MKRILTLLLLCALLVTPGCAGTPPEDDGVLTIVATTYPVYLFTTAVVGDTEGVEVLRLVKEPTSCLHDYTLTVEDMKTIERADVIVMNGAGLEDFMASALERSKAPVIDCSARLKERELLLPAGHEDHDSHDHEAEYDPHIWMDPACAGVMLTQLGEDLAALDEAHREAYAENASDAVSRVLNLRLFVLPQKDWPEEPAGLITFHDGFRYFADAFGIPLLAAVEEEAGSTVSARELKEIAALVEKNHIPAIFVEKNGSTAGTRVIANETGCRVYELDLLMSGDGWGIQPYLDAMEKNLDTVLEALG